MTATSHIRAAITGLRRIELIALFGLLTVFTPIGIDLYLPALPTIAREFGTPIAAIEHSLAAFFLGLCRGPGRWSVPCPTASGGAGPS